MATQATGKLLPEKAEGLAAIKVIKEKKGHWLVVKTHPVHKYGSNKPDEATTEREREKKKKAQ